MASNQLNKLNRHLLRQALDALPAAALIVDAQTRDRLVLLANPAAARLCGLTIAELVGRSINGLLVDPPDTDGTEPWRLRHRSGGVATLVASPLYASPGVPACWLLTALDGIDAGDPIPALPVEATTTPSKSPGLSGAGELPSTPRSFEPAATGTFSVTDSWIRMRDDRNDPATGVLARDVFLELMHRDASLARRSERGMAVILFRVEAVETYQGLFGRHATDACLRKVAHAISTGLRRGSDACGRTGHDLFAVLSHGGDADSTAEFAARIAQRVRDLAIHHPRCGAGRYVLVSWGLAMIGPGRARSDADPLVVAENDLERRLLTVPGSATASAG